MGFYAVLLKEGDKIHKGDYQYAWLGSHIMVPVDKENIGQKVAKGDKFFRKLKKMPKRIKKLCG